jgi:hypothetical protein
VAGSQVEDISRAVVFDRDVGAGDMNMGWCVWGAEDLLRGFVISAILFPSAMQLSSFFLLFICFLFFLQHVQLVHYRQTRCPKLQSSAKTCRISIDLCHVSVAASPVLFPSPLLKIETRLPLSCISWKFLADYRKLQWAQKWL